MPFLNWRELEIKASVSPHPRRGNQMTLEVPGHALSALIHGLEKVFSHAQGELRVDLPSGWVLFWKEREGESRLLLARPNADSWVATAALTREHGLEVLVRLRKGEPVSVGEIAIVASMSNVEIELRALS
jgi:hypothetical protein